MNSNTKTNMNMKIKIEKYSPRLLVWCILALYLKPPLKFANAIRRRATQYNPTRVRRLSSKKRISEWRRG